MLKKILKKVWVNSLPLRLRVIQGKAKFGLGIFVQLCTVAVFVAILSITLNSTTTTSYLSITLEDKISTLEKVNCFEIPVSQSSEVEVDELGYWSTEPSFDSRKSLKEVHFRGFNGGLSEYDEEINQLNDCIDEMNIQLEQNSLIDNLLYLDSNHCEGARGSQIHYPIKWPYVFDASYSDVWFLDNNGDRIWDITATVEVSSSSLYKLSITCPTYYVPADICSAGETIDIILNVDSLARCISVNKGLIDPTYTLDLQPLSEAPDFLKGYYIGTDSPNVMALLYDTCYIEYSDKTTFLWLEPSIRYYYSDCNLPCNDSARTNCYDEFDLEIVLTHYGDSGNKSEIVINTYGGQGTVNTNYYLLDKTNSSCSPLLNHLKTSEESVPFTLIESFYNCTSITRISPLVALSSAYANTSLAAEVLVAFVVIMALRLCSGSSKIARYGENTIETAVLELAIARIEKKTEMNRHEDSFVLDDSRNNPRNNSRRVHIDNQGNDEAKVSPII